MKIERELVVKVKIDDKTELKKGDKVKFIANNAAYVGKFVEVRPRGSLLFECDVADQSVVFGIMPNSIKAIEVL